MSDPQPRTSFSLSGAEENVAYISDADGFDVAALRPFSADQLGPEGRPLTAHEWQALVDGQGSMAKKAAAFDRIFDLLFKEFDADGRFVGINTEKAWTADTVQEVSDIVVQIRSPDREA